MKQNEHKTTGNIKVFCHHNYTSIWMFFKQRKYSINKPDTKNLSDHFAAENSLF